MTQDTYPGLVNQFLIAMPELQDPNFSRTVTLICQHDANGALGVVINRPMEQLTLQDILDQFDLSSPASDSPIGAPVYLGGPVQQQLGLVLHEGIGEWGSTLKISDELGLTSSRDILESMSTAQGPNHALLTLGYAGWGAGQLEDEIQDNAWLSVEADCEIIFRTPPKERWQAAAAKIGVDISQLAPGAGHA
ncbi:MAG TPA: YqgE/AlgH family protein [Arenicellales bacterium]|jgi:putative transcriptional regulator|nr:YqgE/AlgH family protein [Arenicellales bacterium]MDP7221146.1 YqgE/AlgH family protein [Arenicellales bacterium]HJP10034.1 YqgE/AlgH family protein [Arenicellales bacterium]|tara:strand:+ start:58 stop:633 length:576 start_codon:yes stop_codon:yes gene_type:complete